jgi:hypothetical protein
VASRVVYIERSERGSRLTGLRLMLPRSSDAWSAPLDDSDDVVIDSAAGWISSKAGPGGRISALVLDADGGVCSWATVPGRDLGVVETVVRQHSEGLSEPRSSDPTDSGGSSGGSGVVWFYAPGSSDSTIQPLGATPVDPGSEADARERTAVLSVGDGIGRVLVDRIDRLGIETTVACTIWHAMASAWDPATAWKARTSSPGNVVESEPSVVAVVLVEPSGRLLWSWTRGGRLLAAGSQRLPRMGGGDDQSASVLLTSDAAARLTADWLAWSAQLAMAPGRVVMLVPTSAEEPGDLSIGAGGFGRALASGWSGAAVDLVVHDDPVGATLQRLAELVDERDGIITASETLDPSMTLVGLSTRPGGAHRKLYIWTSLAVSAGAIVIGILAWALRVQASGLSSLARQVDASLQEKLKGVTFARPPMPGMELLDLRTEVERARKDAAPLSGIERSRPIVRELEVLSNVLALPDFELTSISLDSSKSQVTIQVSAPDLSNAEALNDALGRIAGSEIESWTFTPQSRVAGSDRVPCTYVGTFRAQPAPAATTPQPSAGGGAS